MDKIKVTRISTDEEIELCEAKMTTINTYNGHTIDYLNPNPNEIDIRDIAHNLSFENRFMGQTKKPYSVAQHCVIGSIILERVTDPKFALQFLLHDATEAYVKDIPTPLKRLLGDSYSSIESRFHDAIMAKFGIVDYAHDIVKGMDLIMLKTEKEQLLKHSIVYWPHLENVTPLTIQIEPWHYKVAERKYLEQFKRLTN